MISLRQFASSIWKLFPPGSKGEIFLRSAYHAFNSNILISRYQIRKAENTYLGWKKNHDKQIKAAPPSQKKTPSVTFVLRCLTGDEEDGLRTIASIKNQSLGEWKLVICSSIGLDSEIMQLEISNDNRIQLEEKIPSTFSHIFSITETEYYVFCNSGDVFSEHFMKIFGIVHAENPETDLFSFDIEIINTENNKDVPFFKPSEFSPEFLLSKNYLSRSIIKANILKVDLILLLEEFFESEWELLLNASQSPMTFSHIPYMIVSICEFVDSIQSNQPEIIFKKYSGSTLVNTVDEDLGESLSREKVSIIIPTVNNFHKLDKLLKSIIEITADLEYEIILVDTGSSDPRVFALYDELKRRENFKKVDYEGEFNYSKAINLGASFSKGNLLLFLNNDIEVIHSNWLSELAKWACIPGVGIVGTKLLFPDHRIQHAGVVLGLQGFTGNIYKNAPDHYFGFTGSLDWPRNMSAVSGACQMMKREVFVELGGYDPKFKIVFGDVDLCLRAIQKGLRVVYAPGAALLHYEGRSRGYLTPVEDMINGFEMMEPWLANGDPFYSPHLTYTTIPACDLNSDSDGSRLKNILSRRASLKKFNE